MKKDISVLVRIKTWEMEEKNILVKSNSLQLQERQELRKILMDELQLQREMVQNNSWLALTFMEYLSKHQKEIQRLDNEIQDISQRQQQQQDALIEIYQSLKSYEILNKLYYLQKQQETMQILEQDRQDILASRACRNSFKKE